MTRILSVMGIHLLGLHSVLSLFGLCLCSHRSDWTRLRKADVEGKCCLVLRGCTCLSGDTAPLWAVCLLWLHVVGQLSGESLGSCVWGAVFGERGWLCYTAWMQCLVWGWHISYGLYRACCGHCLAGAEVNVCKCNTFCLLLLLLLPGQSSELAFSPRWAGLNPVPLVRTTSVVNSSVELDNTSWSRLDLLGLGLHCVEKISFKAVFMPLQPKKAPSL